MGFHESPALPEDSRLATYEVIWTTASGERVVVVEAELSDRGGVQVFATRDRETGERVSHDSFMTSERRALYDAIRRAAGICSECCGSKKTVRLAANRGRQEEFSERCGRCSGSGKEPRAS